MAIHNLNTLLVLLIVSCVVIADNSGLSNLLHDLIEDNDSSPAGAPSAVVKPAEPTDRQRAPAPFSQTRPDRQKYEEYTPTKDLPLETLRRRLIVYLAEVEAEIKEKKLQDIVSRIRTADTENVDEEKAWQFIKSQIGDEILQ